MTIVVIMVIVSGFQAVPVSNGYDSCCLMIVIVVSFVAEPVSNNGDGDGGIGKQLWFL